MPPGPFQVLTRSAPLAVCYLLSPGLSAIGPFNIETKTAHSGRCHAAVLLTAEYASQQATIGLAQWPRRWRPSLHVLAIALACFSCAIPCTFASFLTLRTSLDAPWRSTVDFPQMCLFPRRTPPLSCLAPAVRTHRGSPGWCALANLGRVRTTQKAFEFGMTLSAFACRTAIALVS